MKKKKQQVPEPSIFLSTEEEIKHRIALLEEIDAVQSYEDHVDHTIKGMVIAYNKVLEIIEKNKLFK